MAKKTKPLPQVKPVPAEERSKALKAAMDSIEKTFGAGSVVRLGDRTIQNIEVIPSGIMTLDVALGAGGYPRGRIIEIYGHESSGKTTVTLQAIAACQKQGGTAAFIDAEHALDPNYAKNIGVDVDNLLLSQPDHGEQALDITEALVRSGAVDLIVIDSVAALVPRSEIEGSVSDSVVGLQARMMSKALRKLTSVIARSNCVCIFINQLRQTISTGGYGGPSTTTTGGRALKFYSSVRLEVKKSDMVKGSGESKDSYIGMNVTVRAVKNKVAPPFGETTFTVYFGRGVDPVVNVLDVAAELNLVRKSGSWFSYEGKNIGQGLEKTADYLRANPEVFAEIEEKVRERFGKKDQAVSPQVGTETSKRGGASSDFEDESDAEELDEAFDDEAGDEDLFDNILGLEEL